MWAALALMLIITVVCPASSPIGCPYPLSKIWKFLCPQRTLQTEDWVLWAGYSKMYEQSLNQGWERASPAGSCPQPSTAHLHSNFYAPVVTYRIFIETRHTPTASYEPGERSGVQSCCAVQYFVSGISGSCRLLCTLPSRHLPLHGCPWRHRYNSRRQIPRGGLGSFEMSLWSCWSPPVDLAIGV